MLILSPTAGQRVCIGGDIQIVVLHAGGDGVHLGFVAPPELAITRQDAAATETAEPQSLADLARLVT